MSSRWTGFTVCLAAGVFATSLSAGAAEKAHKESHKAPEKAAAAPVAPSGPSVIVVGALLAASTGIVGATVVTMGLLALPTMLRRGYDPAIATGTPPMLAALALGFIGNLFGGISHYASGPAGVIFGSGYVPTSEWFRVGFLMSVVNIII